MKVIKDAIHGNIEFSFLEKEFFSSITLNRLHNVKQTSLTYLVFPSAQHSRFSHSIGVMHVASQIFRYAIANASLRDGISYLYQRSEDILNLFKQFDFNFSPPIQFSRESSEDMSLKKADDLNVISSYESDFLLSFIGKNKEDFKKEGSYTETKEVIIRYIKDQVNLGKFLEYAINSIFGKEFFLSFSINFLTFDFQKEIKEIFQKVDNNTLIFTYFMLLQALRIKALFHDIGHYPFSHIVEFAVENYQLSKKEITKEDKALHEQIGEKLTKIIFENLLKKIVEKIRCSKKKKKNEQEVFYSDYDLLTLIILKLIYKLVKAISLKKEDGKDEIIVFEELGNVISSTLDADRIDFVYRDGITSGLFTSSTDIHRIIKFYKLEKVQDKNVSRYLIFPTVQALNDIQQLLADRYRIYKFLLNHHKVKKMDGILQRCIEIELVLNEGKTVKEKENEFFGIHLLLDVVRENDSRWLEYYIHQLTDEWLTTLLKNRYYRLSLKKKKNDLENELYILLNELFTFSNRVISVWKRDHDYKEAILNAMRVEPGSKDFDVNIEKSLKETYKALKDQYSFYREAERTIEKLEEKEFYEDKLFLILQTLFLHVDFRHIETKLRENEIAKSLSKYILIIPSSLNRKGPGFEGIYKLLNMKVSAEKIENLKSLNDYSRIYYNLFDNFLYSIKFFLYYYKDDENNDKSGEKDYINSNINNVVKFIIRESINSIRESINSTDKI